jgi:hypothetical protein
LKKNNQVSAVKDFGEGLVLSSSPKLKGFPPTIDDDHIPPV